MEQVSRRIGDVARAAGLSVDAVRYYEREGLLPRVRRRASGYREFDPDALRRLRFVKRARDLGFTLDEVRDLLSLRVARGTTCAHVRDRAAAKLADVEAKMHELERMQRALRRLVRECGGRGPTSDCPLLDALDAEHPETKP